MNKNITFQLKNVDNEVIKESNITISDNDTLIMKFSKDITLETANEVFNFINGALERDEKFIGIPEGIELQVLNKS